MIRYIDVINVGGEPKQKVREIEESSYHIENQLVEVISNNEKILIPLERIVWIK